MTAVMQPDRVLKIAIAAMDTAGIDFTVLSQTSPGVQIERDVAKATRLAREANDVLAERIRRHPTRLGDFAHLALQDPMEDAKVHLDWIDAAPWTDSERADICHRNAMRILIVRPAPVVFSS